MNPIGWAAPNHSWSSKLTSTYGFQIWNLMRVGARSRNVLRQIVLKVSSPTFVPRLPQHVDEWWHSHCLACPNSPNITLHRHFHAFPQMFILFAIGFHRFSWWKSRYTLDNGGFPKLFSQPLRTLRLQAFHSLQAILIETPTWLGNPRIEYESLNGNSWENFGK